MNDKKFIPILVIVAAVVGVGFSLLNWGDKKGVHGTGWPIPTQVSGLPEDESNLLGVMSELGAFGFILNIALALLAVLLLWAILKIFLRITGKA